ncbi:putative diguanylate cyclase [Comamonadaceae bacterium]
MPQAPLPDNESRRLAALHDLGILDTAPEQAFDALVQAAAVVCNVPISLISLVDTERQWFKANVGLPGVTETPRALAFCAHAILGDEILEVPDATADVRFADNALVTGNPDIRFYAGAPLRLGDGTRAGTFCVIDRVPRQLTEQQREILSHLAAAAVHALEGRRAIEHERQLHLEAQKTAQILAENELRFRALSEVSPLGVFATDAQGACTYTNSRWQEIYGLDYHQSLGDGWMQALHPDDKGAVFTEWQQTALQRLEFDAEFRISRGDGEVRTVRARARANQDESGNVTGYVGSVEDITERKRQDDALRQSEQRLQRTGQVARVGGWELDLATGALVWSGQTHEIHGVPPDFVPEVATAINFYAPEARPKIQAAVEKAMTTGEGWDLELPFIQANGTEIWVRAVGAAEFHEGAPVRLVGTFQDITKLHNIRADLARQHELLRVTLQSIGDAVITTDAAGEITWLNPVAERMTGWLNTEAKGKPIGHVFHIVNEETRAPTENPVTTCLAQGKTTGLAHQTVLISREGEEYGIEDSAAPIRSDSGEILGVVLVFHDVTEQRRLSGEMSFRATHDALTGLVNRTEFETRLRNVLNRAHEDRSNHALLFIDLDQFKLVNDACGHSVGDQLLQQVSKLLSEVVRTRDTLARLGGDEFGVILEHCSAEHAQRVAQQICERMDDFRFIHDGKRFRIGTSIGLVPVDNRWANVAAAMQAADISCYAAKDAGRNRVHAWFDTDLAMHARHGEMQWAARLEQALDENRFVLYAQRITALDDGVHGLHAEVLVRLRETDGSLVQPGAFLPAAERFHLASRIDRWVLKHAIQCLRDTPHLSGIDTLCVNLSGQSIGDRAFHRQAFEMLQNAGPAICQRICLEITETAAVTNMADASVFVEQAKKLGLRIALDDFGAGASSFGYLKNLSVDLLKIDGQFIRDVIDDPLDDAAVRCFAAVAQVVGVKTVAEFVDRAEVLERVREIGIDFVQGYYLHKPEAIDIVLESAQKAHA